ncbi:NADP-dependent oxidoreductase domain-containing protein [Gongronella butleri]|nr:NADP-dependent oxidoreductase domain-containing protein [Gongronella butleri]
MTTQRDLEPVVMTALKEGYRLLDSATVYRNEKVLGTILKKALSDDSLNLTRKDLFITSKLAPKDQGYEKCYQAVLDSLERFDLEYLDVYFIHWPGTSKTKTSDAKNRENRLDSYRALEKLYEEGKIKQIGVSNFTVAHLNDLLENCKVVPHVHQFELHPCLYQKEVIALCEKHKIQVQAYSSLGEGELINGGVVVPGLDAIAKRLETTQARVLLRWALQHHWAIIPKSKTPARVKENGDVWDIALTDEDMELLDKAQETQRHRFCWDPTEIA